MRMRSPVAPVVLLVTTNTFGDTPSTAESTPVLVVVNLLDNAVGFTASATTVTVAARLTFPAASPTVPAGTVTVLPATKGVPSAHVNRVDSGLVGLTVVVALMVPNDGAVTPVPCANVKKTGICAGVYEPAQGPVDSDSV